MCFSASASFSAGIILSATGVVCIKKVQHPSQIAFASIPFLFGLQQLAEGFLWLTLPGPNSFLQPLFTHIFLFFAQVVWPVLVPVAVLLLEKDRDRRAILKGFVATGVCVAGYLGWCLIFNQVAAEIIGSHISYHQNYPAALSDIGGMLYVIATVAPPFFSHAKKMWTLGTAILLSYIISQLFYQHYIVSVWCFFAAIISGPIYLILLQVNKTTEEEIKNNLFLLNG